MNSRRSRAWWLLLLVPLALGLGRLRIDTEVLDLLPPDPPAVRGLKMYQEHFANARELILTLRAADAARAERLAGVLASRLRGESNLAAAVSWQPPWMENPAQAAEIAGYLWFNQPPAIFGELTNRLSAGRLHSALAESREVLATSLSPMDIAVRSFDPYDLMNVPALANFSGASFEQGQRMFASEDGTLRILYVTARPALADYAANSVWLESLRKIVADIASNGSEWEGVKVRYTGRPAFVAEIAGSMRRDLSGSVIGTALIIAALFWLMHRRWLPMLWLHRAGKPHFGDDQRHQPGIRRRADGVGGGLRGGPLPGSLVPPGVEHIGNPARDFPQYSLGGHHHHQRLPGPEFWRAAGTGPSGHVGGGWGCAGGYGHGAGLFAAAFPGAMEGGRKPAPPAVVVLSDAAPPKHPGGGQPGRSFRPSPGGDCHPCSGGLRRSGDHVSSARAGQIGQRAEAAAQRSRSGIG